MSISLKDSLVEAFKSFPVPIECGRIQLTYEDVPLCDNLQLHIAKAREKGIMPCSNVEFYYNERENRFLIQNSSLDNLMIHRYSEDDLDSHVQIMEGIKLGGKWYSQIYSYTPRYPSEDEKHPTRMFFNQIAQELNRGYVINNGRCIIKRGENPPKYRFLELIFTPNSHLIFGDFEQSEKGIKLKEWYKQLTQA